MRVQRVEMFVCPMATPNDTSGLQALVDEGRVKPASLVALVGKTEGTGFHDDWGRVLADIALQVVLIVLGLIRFFDIHALLDPIHLGDTPQWDDVIFATGVAVVVLAYLRGEQQVPAPAIE